MGREALPPKLNRSTPVRDSRYTFPDNVGAWLGIALIGLHRIHLVFQSALRRKAAIFILQGVALPLSYAGMYLILNFSDTILYFSMTILTKKHAFSRFF